jgi:cytochrome c peroxidase
MKKIALVLFIITSTAMVMVSCKKNWYNTDTSATDLNLPAVPYDYKGLKNDNEATLGRVLFYDKQLSINNTISCGSCHKQSLAFADNVKFSEGFKNVTTSRNSPGIINTSKKVNFFWDCRTHDLRKLSLEPVHNQVEMGFFEMSALPAKIAAINYYPSLFEKAYGTKEITEEKIANAIANFVASINSDNTLFDQHNMAMLGQMQSSNSNGNVTTNGGPASSPLNAIQLEGLNLFVGKYNCVTCHNMNLVTGNGTGYNNGSTVNNNDMNTFPAVNEFVDLGFNGEIGNELDVTNRQPRTATVEEMRIATANIGIDGSNGDVGFFTISGNAKDKGRVRIPDLRNVTRTAPYMHDGRFLTIEDVLNHYSHGISDNVNLDARLKDAYGNPAVLNISAHDKLALKAFLETLTDNDILHDAKFSDPFIVKQ